MKPGQTFERAPLMLEEKLNALHTHMLSMRTAAMNEDWSEMEKLDTARVFIVDAIRHTKSNSVSQDYSSICQKIRQLDQEILGLIRQKYEATASKLTRETQFKKASDLYNKYSR